MAAVAQPGLLYMNLGLKQPPWFRELYKAKVSVARKILPRM